MRRVETLSEGPGPPLTTTAGAQAIQAQRETQQDKHNTTNKRIINK